MFHSKRDFLKIILHYPILRSLPVFLFGQVMEWFYGIFSAIFSLIILLLPPNYLGFKSCKGMFLLALSYNLGILSCLRPASLVDIDDLELDRSYLATVDEAPRHPKVGRVSLSLKLEKIFELEGNLSKIITPLGARVLCNGIDLPWRNPSSLVKGDTVIFKAKWNPIIKSQNPLSYESSLYRRGYVATCSIIYLTKPIITQSSMVATLQRQFREQIFKISGKSEGSSLFLSMALGSRDVLSSQTEQAFKKTGLSHLLVLSGYQITLVYGSIYLILIVLIRWLSYRIIESGNLQIISAILAFIVTILFTVLTGFESSATRALLAIAAVIISKLTDRRATYWQGVLLAFLGINIIWPLSFLEVGTQLTFAALIGIGLALQVTEMGSLSQLLYVSILASLMTSLVSLAWFQGFSPIGLLINPILAPFFSWLSCNCGFLALFLNKISIDKEGMLFRAIVYLLEMLRDLVEYLSELSISYVEIENRSISMAVAVSTLLLIIVIHKRRYAKSLI